MFQAYKIAIVWHTCQDKEGEILGLSNNWHRLHIIVIELLVFDQNQTDGFIEDGSRLFVLLNVPEREVYVFFFQLPELSQFTVGLMHIQLLHTSASLAINENWDPDVRDDMEMMLNRIVPEDMPFRHSCEGPDDMVGFSDVLIGYNIIFRDLTTESNEEGTLLYQNLRRIPRISCERTQSKHSCAILFLKRKRSHLQRNSTLKKGISYDWCSVQIRTFKDCSLCLVLTLLDS